MSAVPVSYTPINTVKFTPDILTTAKALGGGFPIAAMLSTEKVAKSFNVGSHGSTYGGNPLGCAVALKLLQIVDTPEVLDGVFHKHHQITQQIAQFNQKTELFKDIRGQGLLIGCELSNQFQGKARLFFRVGATNRTDGARCRLKCYSPNPFTDYSRRRH